MTARQIFQSDIWIDKPATWKVIWLYIIGNVNHTETDKFKRGEGFFNFKREIKNIGFDITYDMIRHSLKWFKDNSMISTSRSTRGTVIKVLNFAKYQDHVNYESTPPSTSKAHQKHIKSTPIHKKDKNDKNVKNISKEIEPSSDKEIVYVPEYSSKKNKSRPDINNVVNFLKEKLGATPDGTIADNRLYAKLLLDKLKKDYPSFNSEEQIKFLINTGLNDGFHSKNITNFKYLYYNCQKIIQSIKSVKQGTIQTL